MHPNLLGQLPRRPVQALSDSFAQSDQRRSAQSRALRSHVQCSQLTLRSLPHCQLACRAAAAAAPASTDAPASQQLVQVGGRCSDASSVHARLGRDHEPGQASPPLAACNAALQKAACHASWQSAQRLCSMLSSRIGMSGKSWHLKLDAAWREGAVYAGAVVRSGGECRLHAA